MARPLIYRDDLLRDILKNVRTIAMVGASQKWIRPSNLTMKYLQEKDYRVIPVNPSQAGKKILGETVYASLSDIPDSFDMVNIFRTSEAAWGIVDESINLAKEKQISVIWMQLGVINEAARKKAKASGLKVIMDRCPKIEYARLYS
jgi:predicted CoA-binding protein